MRRVLPLGQPGAYWRALPGGQGAAAGPFQTRPWQPPPAPRAPRPTRDYSARKHAGGPAPAQIGTYSLPATRADVRPCQPPHPRSPPPRLRPPPPRPCRGGHERPADGTRDRGCSAAMKHRPASAWPDVMPARPPPAAVSNIAVCIQRDSTARRLVYSTCKATARCSKSSARNGCVGRHLLSGMRQESKGGDDGLTSARPSTLNPQPSTLNPQPT